MSICRECGKRLSGPGEKHSSEDCGKHHLKRANEILKIKIPQILWDGVAVSKLHIHIAGEEGEMMWISAKLDNKDQDKVSSYYMKGTV